MILTHTIRKTLALLGLIFMVACGSSIRPGAEGGFFVPAGGSTSGGNTSGDISDIILFATKEIYTGDLVKYAPAESLNRARDGADVLCNNYKIAAWDKRTVRAFLAIDEKDNLANMPKNFNIPADRPVVGDAGVEVAKQWSNLFNQDIESTLQGAVKDLSASDSYWTGALKDGSTDLAENCSDWSSLASGTGITGFTAYPSVEWLSAKSNPCDVALQILCIAY